MLAALNDRVRHETPGLAQRDQHTLVRQFKGFCEGTAPDRRREVKHGIINPRLDIGISRAADLT